MPMTFLSSQAQMDMRSSLLSIFTLTHYTGTEGRCVPDYFGLCIAQAFYYCAAIQELEIYFEFSDG
jgi:hypothetical protein